MAQKRPHKANPLKELSKVTKDDRSNLEMGHAKTLSMSIRYSQDALSILVLGTTIAAFSYLILENVITDWTRPVISLVVFSLCSLLAAKKSYLSWRHNLRAQFIGDVLGCHHTWAIRHKLDDKLRQFQDYEYDEKRRRTTNRKRRYCLFLNKIFNLRPFKFAKVRILKPLRAVGIGRSKNKRGNKNPEVKNR